MTTAWSAIAKPTRGVTTDGFNADGTGDGFYAPLRGDGFLVSDGDWMPVLMDSDAWTAVAKPTGGAAHLADGTYLADASITADSEEDWVRVIV